MAGRIVYIVPTPSPNRNAEMDRVAEELGVDAVHLIFVEAEYPSASAPKVFPEICRYHCLDRLDSAGTDSAGDVLGLLDQLDPTLVIVSGYAHRVMRQAMDWCQRRNVEYCLRSDGSIWTDILKGRFKYLVRRTRLVPRVREARVCLIGGRSNRDYWKRYGMQQHQEGWWPQWIEYDHFAKARHVDSFEREALLESHGITTWPNFLYVGRHIPLKNIDRLCLGLLDCDPNAGLILVGSGSEAETLRRRFAAKLEGRLHMVGNVTHEALPKWYAAADAFTLASGARENWGMVVNEATTAGLPVICDEKVGSVGDLVSAGRNGVTLRTNSATEWGEVMRTVAAKPEQLRAMGRESIEIADRWKEQSDPAECARALLELIR